MKVQLLFAWYDLWIGAFYDAKKRWIYILPIPMFGIIIKLPPKKKPVCFEIWRPNIPDDGCKTQCIECAEIENKRRSPDLE